MEDSAVAMSESEQAKAIIRRWNDEGWSGGRYDLAHELISPNMVVHGAGDPVAMGPEGLVDLIRTWRTAFPDGHMEIDDLIVDGDTVAIRNTWRGTHQAELYGVPPTGKSVAVTSIGIDRVRDGKVTEGWGELDTVGLMQQLGALPLVGPGAVASGVEPVWGESVAEANATAHGGETKRLLLRLIDAFATVDAGEAHALADPEAFRDHSPAFATDTLDSVLELYASLRCAFPDLRVEVDEANMVGEGNQAAAHSVWRGTWSGETLFGVEPSGDEVVWTQSDFVRAKGARIVERWTATDTLTLYQQLGLLPLQG